MCCEICKKIGKTSAGWSVNLLRLFIAWIFIKSGAGKLFGWFDGPGIENFITFMGSLGFLSPMAYFVGWTEFIGGILFAFGLLTRVTAVSFIIVMVVAIVKVHPNDYFYPATVLMSSLVILHLGAGKFSLDWLLTRNK